MKIYADAGISEKNHEIHAEPRVNINFIVELVNV